MSYAHLPDWNVDNLLPPIGADSTSAERSPFLNTPLLLVQRFCSSPTRATLLRGFLRHRQELYNIGLQSGFQWINGSFVEHVEAIRGRPPKDIDIVTFFNATNELQAAIQASRTLPEQLDVYSTIRDHGVHNYFINLGLPPDQLVRHSTYWYSLWSHQRDTSAWKGFVRVDLDLGGDMLALEELDRRDLQLSNAEPT